MSPEYGATCGFFPVDDDTIKYLRDTGRSADRIALVAAYAKAQGMFRSKSTPDRSSPTCSSSSSHRRTVARRPQAPAGPHRPQEVKNGFTTAMVKEFNKAGDGGGKDVFELHPSIASAPLDKNFAKAGTPSAFRSRAAITISVTAMW